MEFRILDLFSGAGGFSKGLDYLSEFNTVLATDFSNSALTTFINNFPNAEIICGDITDSKTKQNIIKKAKELKVNMIIGGPPCQGFSNKGKKMGLNDPRNFLFKEYLSIVKSIKPDIFIIENVKSMLTSNNGYFLNQILDSINKMNYYSHYNFITASDYGVPQNRQRAIIIASKIRKINLPKSCGGNKNTVKDAIGDLAYLNSGQGSQVAKYIQNPISNYQKSMRKNSKILFNHIATNHSKIALEKLKLIPAEGNKKSLPKELHGNQKFNTTWGRLKWNSQSPTIDTRFDTPSNGTNTHPELNRAITPREAARLQSFPDTFRFYGKKTEICKQIGNAVPPLMAKAIGKNIIKELSE